MVMSISYNYLIVFNKTTKRVEHFAYSNPHIPILPDDYPEFEESTQDYVVLLNQYDLTIWDSTDREVISDAAAESLGIAESQISKYVRDITVTENLTDEYLWDETTQVVTYSPLIVSAQRKYLDVGFISGDSLVTVGGGPSGLDSVVSIANYLTNYDWQHPQSVLSSYPMTIRVTKRFSDGTVDTTATDVVTLTPTGGLTGILSGAMTAGVKDFEWTPGIESKVIQFEATSNQNDTDPGKFACWVAFAATSPGTDTTKKAFIADYAFHLPGVVTVGGGPLTDGAYFEFQIPTTPKNSSYAYYHPQAHRIILVAGVAPSGGSLTLQLLGVSSGKYAEQSLGDGEYTTGVTSQVDMKPSSDDYFTPGEIIRGKITAANSAASVNVIIRFE